MYICSACSNRMYSKGYPCRGPNIHRRRIRCDSCQYQLFEDEIQNIEKIEKIEKIQNSPKLLKDLPCRPFSESLADFRLRQSIKGLKRVKKRKLNFL